jgi:transposase
MFRIASTWVFLSNVALRRGINANVVRKWLPPKGNNAVANARLYVLQLAPVAQAAPEAPVSIEIPYEEGALTVMWPASGPVGVARFVRGLTRCFASTRFGSPPSLWTCVPAQNCACQGDLGCSV